MPYIIDTHDKEHAHALRQALSDKHLEYLEQNQALLLACGAKLDDDGITGLGSFYIVNVEARQEAEEFINNDPFTKGALFDRISITRWRKSYLDGKCYL